MQEFSCTFAISKPKVKITLMTSSDDVIRVIIIWLFSELLKSHRRHHANVFTDWVGRSAPNVLFVFCFTFKASIEIFKWCLENLLSCDQPKKRPYHAIKCIRVHACFWNVTQWHISVEANYFVVYVNFENDYIFFLFIYTFWTSGI